MIHREEGLARRHILAPRVLVHGKPIRMHEAFGIVLRHEFHHETVGLLMGPEYVPVFETIQVEAAVGAEDIEMRAQTPARQPSGMAVGMVVLEHLEYLIEVIEGLYVRPRIYPVVPSPWVISGVHRRSRGTPKPTA